MSSRHASDGRRVAGIVLAAGPGTRFRGVKQVALFLGRPLIEWPINALAGAGVDPLIVVLGANAGAVAAGANLQGVTVVHSAEWRKGQSESLKVGLSAAAGADAAIVVLADQPLISPEAVRRVATAGGPTQAVRATYAGVPAHPTLIPSSLWESVEQLEGDRGAAGVLASVGFLEVPCDGLGSPADVDTPEALERLAQQVPPPSHSPSAEGKPGAAVNSTP